MFTNDNQTSFKKNKFYRQFNNHKQWYSDNDEDCSCSSCECSTYNDENIIGNNNTISFNPDQSMNMSTTTLTNKTYYPRSHINNSPNYFDKHSRFSINYNRPSINSLKESSTNSTPSQIKQNIVIPNELISTKTITEQQSTTSSIENHKTNEPKSTPIDLEYIYEIVDQSYAKLPILYNSIKQTKLDADFILSVNDYLDRLKSNIYKDLIRRETLLRNGKTHTQHLISLIRCICKISYEQSLETSNDFNTSKHATLYTMTAIDYILQRNFPQKKPLFNYILNEYISMWLHENLRIIQEDFSIILEHGTNKNFFSLCLCLFHKLESLCAINWERLQMIQNYRLTHFEQLMKPTSIKLETNKDFILLFGKPLKSTMKRSEIPVTSIYSNRTDNELINIDDIHHTLTKSIAQILLVEHQKLMLTKSHSREIITPSVEITSPISTKLINVHLDANNKEISQSSILDGDKPVLSILDQQEKKLLSADQFLISSSSDIINERQRSSPSESKLVSLEHQQLLFSVEITPKQDTTPKSVHQSSSQSTSLLSQSRTSIEMKNDTSSIVKITEHINSSKESVSTQTTQNKGNSPINLLSIDPSLQELSTLIFTSPEKPLTYDHHSSSSFQIDSKTILNTEVNALIQFLTDLASSSLSVQQENEPPSLLKQLETCLKQNNIESNSIIKSIRHTHPQSSLDVNDPIFLAAFTRVLRKELEDAQILRQIDRGQLNEDSQNIGYLSFETRNILKLPKIDPSFKNKDDAAAGDNIDQDRVFIEVTHDPSKCTPQHQRFNHDGSLKSTDTILSSTECAYQQSPSMETNRPQQRKYWIRSNEDSPCKDCTITPSSLFCARKLLDKNTHSITVEHNEGLR